MREDEANAKRCPFVRLANGTQATNYTVNRGESAGLFCIASACMAWRWSAPEREERRNYRDDLDRVQPRPGTAHDYPDGWTYSHSDSDYGRMFDLLHRLKSDSKLTGYCGLAGQPA